MKTQLFSIVAALAMTFAASQANARFELDAGPLYISTNDPEVCDHYLLWYDDSGIDLHVDTGYLNCDINIFGRDFIEFEIDIPMPWLWRPQPQQQQQPCNDDGTGYC